MTESEKIFLTNEETSYNILSISTLLNLTNFLPIKDILALLTASRRLYSFKPIIPFNLYGSPFLISKVLKFFGNTDKIRVTGLNITLNIDMKDPHLSERMLSRLLKLRLSRNLSETSNSPFNMKSINLSSLSFCANLEVLYINNTIIIENLIFLKNCTNLFKLSLHNCHLLTSLDGIGNCTKLEYLYLEKCYNLTDANALRHCEKLRHFELEHSASLTSLEVLNNFPKLRYLKMSGLKRLTEIILPRSLIKLLSLKIHDCDNLLSLIVPDNLISIVLSNCPNLTDIFELLVLKNLKILSIKYSDILLENIKKKDDTQYIYYKEILNKEKIREGKNEEKDSTKEDLVAV